jgi:D-amino-acid dehydrogenase
MRIAVIGAGIVGITSAYELAKDGHDVCVLEKSSATAEGSSFANSGILAPSLMVPLSHPGWPSGRLFNGLFDKNGIDPYIGAFARHLRWLLNWKMGTNPDTFIANFKSLHRLMELSQKRIHEVVNEASIEHEHGKGQLVLLKTDTELVSLREKLIELKDLGLSFREVTLDEARKIEPALGPNASFASAVYFPDDEVGNCRQFAILLKNQAQASGVKFKFNTSVSKILTTPSIGLWLEGETAPMNFDCVVVANGIQAEHLLNPLKVRLPMAPIIGHTLSAQIKETLNAPKGAVLDLHTGTHVVRLGQRIRVAQARHLGTPHNSYQSKTVKHLYQTLQLLFPGAIRFANGAQAWKGAYNLMSDGLPVIGASTVPGVWLNLGHGPNGWGMALGAARLLANEILQKDTGFGAKSFNYLRFQH